MKSKVCRYKLIKVTPRSEADLHRELDGESYGAIIEKEIELTEKEMVYMVEDFGPDMYEYNEKLEDSVHNKIRKVLE